MGEKIGGDIIYYGKEPLMAHRVMYIMQEQFDLRHECSKSLLEMGMDKELAERSLRTDYAFYRDQPVY